MFGPTHVETASGMFFDLVTPAAEHVRLADIAHGLAQENRYGHARRPISVAEHALLVADRLRALDYDPAIVLGGLHHDDHEAYTGDIRRPVKLIPAVRPAIKAVEREIDRVIATALGLPPVDGDGRMAIAAADEWALSAESYHLMPSMGRGWTCDGLYGPEDPLEVPALYRLRETRAPAWDTMRVIWLCEHDRLMRSVVKAAA